MMSYSEVINILVLIIAMVFVIVALFLPRYERKLFITILENVENIIHDEVKFQLHDFVDKYFTENTVYEDDTRNIK